MSKKEKLLERFLSIPAKKDLTFEELSTLLIWLGYKKIEGEGSGVKFFNEDKNSLINLHRPHPTNILKIYLVKQIQEKLKEVL